jgi:hypothetical protein
LNINCYLRIGFPNREKITSLFITRFGYARLGVSTLSTVWGLLPLGMDESDLMMLLLALFLLAVLVIAMFIVLPWFYAVLGTLGLIGAIYYGVWELRKGELEQEKKEM